MAGAWERAAEHHPGFPCSAAGNVVFPTRCLRINSPEQMTPASSWWPQSWENQPPCGHCHSLSSVPMHSTLPKATGPRPGSKCAPLGAATALPQASCLHTTWASRKSQPSSHTVPQVPLECSSTLPSHRCPPLASLRATSGNADTSPGHCLQGRPGVSSELTSSGSGGTLLLPGGRELCWVGVAANVAQVPCVRWDTPGA